MSENSENTGCTQRPRKIVVSPKIMRLFAKSNTVDFSTVFNGQNGLDAELRPNEYVEIQGDGRSLFAVFDTNHSKANFTLVDSRGEAPKAGSHIRPRNEEQKLALHLCRDTKIPLVVLEGPAGTGKSLMAMKAAYENLLGKKYRKLMVFRPTDEVGKTLGFLPGDMDEKYGPFAKAVFDTLEILAGDSEGKKTDFREQKDLFDRERIEILPINFVRGRTFSDTCVIIDEAQNLTSHQLKTVITRAGVGTKVIVTGDLGQIDIWNLEKKNSGLSRLVESLEKEGGNKLFANVSLTKVERSPLAALVARIL